MELKLTDSWEQKMRAAWEHFSAGDETYDYSVVRLPVLESWKRSRASGVNPLFLWAKREPSQCKGTAE